MSLKTISPFGPKMARLTLPKSLINQINKEVDKITTNKILSKKYNYSKKLAGEVQQEIQLPINFINKHIKKFLETNLKTFIMQSTGKKTKSIK